jgi:hypothetical protein
MAGNEVWKLRTPRAYMLHIGHFVRHEELRYSGREDSNRLQSAELTKSRLWCISASCPSGLRCQ